MIATYHGTSMSLLALTMISVGLWLFAEFKGKRIHRLSSGLIALVLVVFFVWCEATRPRDWTITHLDISLSVVSDLLDEGKKDQVVEILGKYENDVMLKELPAKKKRRVADRLSYELVQQMNATSNKNSEPEGSR